MDKKLYEAVISGKSDSNINFNDFRNLIVDLGFKFRNQNGSHITYKHEALRIMFNVQPIGSKAKKYQVAQLRRIIEMYNL